MHVSGGCDQQEMRQQCPSSSHSVVHDRALVPTRTASCTISSTCACCHRRLPVRHARQAQSGHGQLCNRSTAPCLGVHPLRSVPEVLSADVQVAHEAISQRQQQEVPAGMQQPDVRGGGG